MMSCPVVSSSPSFVRVWFRRLLIGGGLLLLALLVAFLAGPRVDLREVPAELSLPADLDAYLASSEASVPGVVPGAEKKIFWAGKPKEQTALAIVYLHGFSATRQETAPLSENLAASLGANLFCTRFTGHGISDPSALGKARVADWLRDAREALAIGRRLGRKVVVLGVSNGGALGTWLAAHSEPGDLEALVLLAPNFGLKRPGGEKLLWPWGEQLARFMVGPTLRLPSRGPLHAKYWTLEYSSSALPQMMGAVALAKSSDLALLRTPVLMIHAEDDPVVSTSDAAAAFACLGSPFKRRILYAPRQGTDHHVLAGSIRSEANTPEIEELVRSFLRELNHQANPLKSAAM